MSNLYKTIVIGGKDVHIVEAHHFALFPWAAIRRGRDSAPTLISLDHHTDTMEAFRGHRCAESNGDFDAAEGMLANLVAAINWESDETLIVTVERLCHDEHIHAAILSKIISSAFSINLCNQTYSIEEEKYHDEVTQQFERELQGEYIGSKLERPSPPYRYICPKDRMFEISSICAIGCEKMPHDDDCEVKRANQALESIYLNHELGTANAMANAIEMDSVEATPYILDIDLDYFHSEKAISPDDPEVFYRLIRNAIAITIALEPECVEELRHDDSDVTADSLLARLTEHIKSAMT